MLFSPSSNQDTHSTMGTSTTVTASTISVGEPTYIADINLSQTSSDQWSLRVDLYFMGPKMDDLKLNYNSRSRELVARGCA
jgi:hypothetical protein